VKKAATVLLFLSFCFFGCADSTRYAQQDTSVSSNSAGVLTFKNKPGWPSQIVSREIGAEFIERIVQVLGDPAGNIWVLRQSENTYLLAETNTQIEKYTSSGEKILEVKTSVGAQFETMVVHPSGELTVVELRPSKNRKEREWRSYQIWLKRISPDGILLDEAPLKDAGNEQERTRYHFEWNASDSKWKFTHRSLGEHSVDEKGITQVSSDNHAALIAFEEDVYLSIWTYGLKVYHYNKDLEIKWGRQILPECDYFTNMASQELLAVDEVGNLYVAAKFFEDDIDVWEMHFGKEVSAKAKDNGFFVGQIDRNGNFKSARIFGREIVMWPVGISVSSGVMTAGGVSRIRNKFNLPNHTMEWDLVFLRATVLDAQTLVSKTIDVKRDDIARDFQVDSKGNGIFAGTNDFVQVDTNSWVEFGQAFLLRVDDQGNQIGYVSFRGPRHSQISTISIGPGDAVVFGGTTDGPITHTAQHDHSQGFEKAMLGVWRF
jgi:hypothetical protein